MISDDKIAEIRERTDIVSLISGYVRLKKAGGNFKGVCPFHADSDPSFNVNPARQFFHCFGCGASGDVFAFVQRIEGMDFLAAVRWLAERCQVDLPAPEERRGAGTADDRERNARREALRLAAEFFADHLWRSGAAAREELARRGVSEDTARTFGLGYAPAGWSALRDHLRAHRVPEAVAEQVGLLVPGKQGGYYDRFRNRLVFPIVDSQGRPLAFSGRALDDTSGAKYVNSPETPEFTKGKVLFGLYQARVAMSKHRTAILVEGNFDVVAMHQAGFDNAVAPLGTALTEDQVALLRRRVDKVVVLFDGDEAGTKAAVRAFPLLAKARLAAYWAVLPAGEDPDSLLRTKGPDAMRGVLERAAGMLDRLIDMAAESSDKSIPDVARRVHRLGELIRWVADPLELDMARRRIAAAFDIDVATVHRFLRTPEAAASPRRTTQEEVLPGTSEERELIGLLLDVPTIWPQVERLGALDFMTTPALRDVAARLMTCAKTHSSSMAEIVSGEAVDPVQRWFARRAVVQLLSSEADAEEALVEIVENMKKRVVSARVEEVERQIRRAHETGDEMMVLALSRKKMELLREMPGKNASFDNEAVRR